MPRYRKIPVEVDAWLFTSKPEEPPPDWITGNVEFIYALDGIYLIRALIHTLEDTMTATLGDYIIRGVEGEFYPCKPDIFRKTYELVVEENTPMPRDETI
jgi:hypothetical protein